MFGFALRGRATSRRRSLSIRSAIAQVDVLETRELLAADMVIQWNDALLDAIRVDRTAPPVASRAMAIVHTAVFDAVNSIDRTHTPYLVELAVHPKASKTAAVAAAAHRVLTTLFAAQKSTFDTLLRSSLAGVPDGLHKQSGILLGRSVADQILSARANDGSTAVVPYTPTGLPGDWAPTPPGFAAALLPQWPGVKPFALTTGSQFRPGAPPALTSSEYTRDFNQVKDIGSATSTTRTADQTAIARFWANGPGTSTPPGHWNVIAQIIAEQRGNSLEENARLFALLNVALADAAITSWDSKYVYDFWRPVTAIQSADLDGNPDTAQDAAWTPLLTTPPFPSYTSGHSTFSGAGAAVLSGFFRSDAIAFTLPSETAGVADRSYTSFSQAADESGVSRIYGGIHFGFDNTAGLSSGDAVGDFVLANTLRRRDADPRVDLLGTQLVIRGTQLSDTIRIDADSRSIFAQVNGRKWTFKAAAITTVFVDAGAGNDNVLGSSSLTKPMEVYAGAGHDYVVGGRANDTLWGEDGSDLLLGADGDDFLDGGRGVDVCFGGNGNDTLVGDRGFDFLFGGSGRNKFIWR